MSERACPSATVQVTTKQSALGNGACGLGCGLIGLGVGESPFGHGMGCKAALVANIACGKVHAACVEGSSGLKSIMWRASSRSVLGRNMTSPVHSTAWGYTSAVEQYENFPKGSAGPAETTGRSEPILDRAGRLPADDLNLFQKSNNAAGCSWLRNLWGQRKAAQTQNRPCARAAQCAGFLLREFLAARTASRLAKFLRSNLFSCHHRYFLASRDEGADAGSQANHEQHQARLKQVAFA